MSDDSVQLSEIDQGPAFNRFVITVLAQTTLYWYQGTQVCSRGGTLQQTLQNTSYFFKDQ
jgi:hypothetical protein